MIYRLAKSLITNGTYTRDDMLNKLSVFLLWNQITVEQYEELAGLIPAAQ